MPSMKDIRVRITSTKNTQQITRAMKMVSAAKLRRAQNNILNARPYSYKLHAVITRLAASGQFSHPLLERVENPRNLLLVVMTSDRGLCGSFNSQILKFTERYYAEIKNNYDKTDFIFIGRRGADHFKRRGIMGVETLTNMAKEIRYELAAQLADTIMNRYSDGRYDQVILVYNEFKSAINVKPVAETMLPITPLQPTLVKTPTDIGSVEEDENASYDYIFEPAGQEILENLLPKHFVVQVYRTMLESIAAEHGARMSAMDSATRNAKEMIRKLTLDYNKLRQAAITKELLEIIGGAEALK